MRGRVRFIALAALLAGCIDSPPDTVSPDAEPDATWPTRPPLAPAEPRPRFQLTSHLVTDAGACIYPDVIEVEVDDNCHIHSDWKEYDCRVIRRLNGAVTCECTLDTIVLVFWTPVVARDRMEISWYTGDPKLFSHHLWSFDLAPFTKCSAAYHSAPVSE